MQCVWASLFCEYDGDSPVCSTVLQMALPHAVALHTEHLSVLIFWQFHTHVECIMASSTLHYPLMPPLPLKPPFSSPLFCVLL